MKFFGKAVCVLLAAVLLAAAIPVSALDNDDKVIVAFGDSITASGAWFSKAEQEFGIKVVNKGVGGENSADGKRRLASVLGLKPDIVVLSFGMNDAALDMAKHVPIETYKQNMTYMVDEMQKRGIKVILLIVNPIGETPYYTRHDKSVFEPYGGANAFFFQYVEAGRALAKEKKLTLIDMYQPLYDTGKWNDYLSDGVHPNNKGYALFAEAFKKALYRVDAGDVNGDGKLDGYDYMMTKAAVLGTYDLGKREVYADADGNGRLEAYDYQMIKATVLGTYHLRG